MSLLQHLLGHRHVPGRLGPTRRSAQARPEVLTAGKVKVAHAWHDSPYASSSRDTSNHWGPRNGRTAERQGLTPVRLLSSMKTRQDRDACARMTPLHTLSRLLAPTCKVLASIPLNQRLGSWVNESRPRSWQVASLALNSHQMLIATPPLSQGWVAAATLVLSGKGRGDNPTPSERYLRMSPSPSPTPTL